MRCVEGVRKSIHQNLLAKVLGLVCWCFKGVQKRPEVGRGQHSSNRVSGISTRTVHQSTTPSLSQTIWPRWASRQFPRLPIVHTFLPVTFGNSRSSEAVVMRKLRWWKRLWRRSLTHTRGLLWGLPEVVRTVQRVHCNRRRLLWRELEFHVCTINKMPIRKKSGNLSYTPRTFLNLKSFNCVQTNELELAIK